MTYKEQKEFETIEDDIAAAETRIEEISQELNQTGSDFEKAQKLAQEEKELNEKLEYMMERWTYLTELHSRADIKIKLHKSTFVVCLQWKITRGGCHHVNGI